MKFIFTIILAAICFGLARCGMQKDMKRDVQTISTHMPKEFSGGNKEELEATYHRGNILYNSYCSGCHSASAGGRDTIPHFSFFQLDDYKDAAMKNDPNNHAVLKKMSQEQVKDVLSFLFYRTLARQIRQEQQTKQQP